MTTKAETSPGPLDTVKLVLAVAVLLGGIGAYNYYADESLLLRVAGILVALAICVVIVFQTTQGHLLWQFIQGSRVEIRKVVWPTRQETFQTTLTVFVFVLILGVFFWALDAFLLWVVGMIRGGGA